MILICQKTNIKILFQKILSIYQKFRLQCSLVREKILSNYLIINIPNNLILQSDTNWIYQTLNSHNSLSANDTVVLFRCVYRGNVIFYFCSYISIIQQNTVFQIHQQNFHTKISLCLSMGGMNSNNATTMLHYPT